VSYWGGWRPHIESALRLDIGRLIECGALNDGARGGWTWRDGYGEEIGNVGYATARNAEGGTLTLLYSQSDGETGERKDTECRIRLSSVPLNYGGRRWYMHCPYTGRRALKLYKFSGIEQFCHRTAIRPPPTYASQRLSGSDRVMAQRWALRRKLGDTFSDLFGEPMKPKRMRWATFERYAERDAELAARENVYFARLIGQMMLKTGV
jgi:hypothetical protein